MDFALSSLSACNQIALSLLSAKSQLAISLLLNLYPLALSLLSAHSHFALAPSLHAFSSQSAYAQLLSNINVSDFIETHCKAVNNALIKV